MNEISAEKTIAGTHLVILARLSGVTGEKHAGHRKQFIQHNRCDLNTDLVAVFDIGFYFTTEEGWTASSGEIEISFVADGRDTYTSLKLMEGDYSALINMPELLVWLAQRDQVGERFSPDDLRQALIEMGFEEQ